MAEAQDIPQSETQTQVDQSISNGIKQFIFETSFIQFGKTKSKVPIWTAAVLFLNIKSEELILKEHKMYYFGFHPPKDLVITYGAVFEANVEFKKIHDEFNFILINAHKKEGPDHFRLLREATNEEKDKVSKKTGNEIQEFSFDDRIVRFKNNPTLVNFIKIYLHTELRENGLISEDERIPLLKLYNDFYPELLDYIKLIPFEQVSEKISEFTLMISQGHEHKDKLIRSVENLKEIGKFIADANEQSEIVPEEETKDEMSQEEIAAAIEEKNKKIYSGSVTPERLERIKGVGPNTAQKLFDGGFKMITQIADTENFEDIQELIGETTAEKIQRAAQKLVDEATTKKSKVEKLEKKVEQLEKKSIEQSKQEVADQGGSDRSVDSEKDQNVATVADSKEEQWKCDECKEIVPEHHIVVSYGKKSEKSKYNLGLCVPCEEEIENKTQEVKPKDLNTYGQSLRNAVTRSLTKINSLNYVPGFRVYRASWSSTAPRKIILSKQWPKYLNSEQREKRKEIIEANGKHQLGASKIGTIIHEHLENNTEFQNNLKEEGWELVEQEEYISFEIDHPDGGSIQLVGHIDGVYRHIKTNQFFIVDYKTRKSDSLELLAKPESSLNSWDKNLIKWYYEKVESNKKQLLVYQHYKGKIPGLLIEVGRNKGEVHFNVANYDENLWEEQKRFWFDIATIETQGVLPEKCGDDKFKFPCSWGKGKSQIKCEFHNYCWEGNN